MEKDDLSADGTDLSPVMYRNVVVIGLFRFRLSIGSFSGAAANILSVDFVNGGRSECLSY